MYTYVVIPQSITCNCNLISRLSTCLSLNLYILNSSVVLPKTEEMNLKAGLRRKTQKIFLILYHKAEALDKGKEEKTANQNPNWMKPKPPKSSGKISTVLTMKSLIYNFHMSNKAHDWVISLSGRDFASKCVSVITSLAPQYLGLPFIISSQTQLVCFQILALCCEPQMYSRFQTQEVVLIC